MIRTGIHFDNINTGFGTEGISIPSKYEGSSFIEKIDDQLMRKIITAGFLLLLYSSFINAQNVSDSSYIAYQQYLKSLVEKIDSRDSTLQYYSGIVDSLQLLKMSSLPAFQKLVYEVLPEKLRQWDREHPVIDYIVKPGDNLWEIAKKKSVYNDPNEWKRIFMNNKGEIVNPDVIKPYQRLQIQNPNFVQEILKDSTLFNEDTLKVFTGKIQKKTFRDIEIEGLIVDQTQTKIGHDFYDLFYSNWQPPDNFGDYTIIIEEKPLPQLGTQVTIKINDNEIFQQILQPRYDVIEAMAQYGVELSFNYIQNYEAIQKQLAGDDLQGSGIF